MSPCCGVFLMVYNVFVLLLLQKDAVGVWETISWVQRNMLCWRCRAAMRWDTAWHRDRELPFTFSLAHQESFLKRFKSRIVTHRHQRWERALSWHTSTPAGQGGICLRVITFCLSNLWQIAPSEAQKICVQRHWSLILYPFYVEKSRLRKASYAPLLHQENYTAFCAARGALLPQRGHGTAGLRGLNWSPCCSQSEESCSRAASPHGKLESPDFWGRGAGEQSRHSLGGTGAPREKQAFRRAMPAAQGIHPSGQQRLWDCCSSRSTAAAAA